MLDLPWPVEAVEDAPQAAAEPEVSIAGLFHDIPSWSWRIFLAAWASFFGLMILFFATSPTAAFMVVIASLFGIMAFALPMTLAAQSRCGTNRCRGAIATHTGLVSPIEAAVQIALIPVAVVIGLLGFILLAM